MKKSKLIELLQALPDLDVVVPNERVWNYMSNLTHVEVRHNATVEDGQYNSHESEVKDCIMLYDGEPETPRRKS